MPELPEVEVVKRSLERSINNLNIKSVIINDPNLRYKIKKEDLKKVIGSKILSIKRRSKFLIILLNNNYFILVHLGMTGKLFIIDNTKVRKKTSFYYSLNERKDKKHDHIIFILKKNVKLIYNDVRKFGFIKIEQKKNFSFNFHLKNLGPEPLNNSFNFIYFKNYIKGRKRLIKDLLMDQKFVSGLGNIYANEILFLSKIKPKRKVRNITDDEIKKIIIFTKKILKKAILRGGSSIKNFQNGRGQSGSFQQNFNVYGKLGKKCSNPDCKGVIRKTIVSQRASFYCFNCQK